MVRVKKTERDPLLEIDDKISSIIRSLKESLSSHSKLSAILTWMKPC